MKNLTFLLLMVPFVVMANPVTDDSGLFQTVFDFFEDMQNFFFVQFPEMVNRWWAWLIIWVTKAKIYALTQSMILAWDIAKQILINLNVMSQIATQVNGLPQDVKQVIVDTGVLDGINLVINAYATRYVMGFMGR